ncbi:MAG TPA: RbsD/FucU domain-containing protein [Albidovulum sp.]|uniref:RbsD/FucU family protein n=1 Tax=Albidovulum sp. TaxID=1872424 RepID=UPI002CD294E0|nr:RbsD/FucU domain-containing protein [Albidovulum sp.]
MLIGLDPVLGPDLLALLRSMGHGDEIAIVDGNYPALTDARRLVRADGLGLIPVLRAVLSVLPIDTSVPQAVFRAVNAAQPDRPDPVHEEIIALCAGMVPAHPVAPLDPAAFYNRVKAAHAIVATSEPRFYANVILRKGVIGG